MRFKLGKKPATYNRKDFRFEHYIKRSLLPGIPAQFGHEGAISDWRMLGNDAYGDCVWAGGAHETMLWNKEVGIDVPFTDESVLSDYSAATGFSADDPNSDQGSDMRAALDYRRKTGVLDANGKRHTIAASVSLEPGNMDHLYAALYLFGAVAIGIKFPDSAMDQFDQGQPWSTVAGAQIQGGHYVSLVAKRDRLVVVSWGRAQQATEDFISTYCDEAYALLSPERLRDGKSSEGFNFQSLQSDLQTLGNRSVSLKGQ